MDELVRPGEVLYWGTNLYERARVEQEYMPALLGSEHDESFRALAPAWGSEPR